jgi:predicted Zn finger-like uncharacterized protein
MIVMCEGCETNFQVEDRFISSTGSKVRCSKCRHVFTAYSPAALAVAEEPLVLSDALPASSPVEVESELPDINTEIDKLFADDFGVAVDASSHEEPELLDVEELLADDPPPASALTTGASDDDLKLDVDLDLNFDEEATAQSPDVDDSAQSSLADSAPVDFAPETETAQDVAVEDTLASLDELGIKLDGVAGMEDDGVPAAAEAGTPIDAEAPGLDLDLELDLDSLMAETAEETSAEVLATGLETVASEEAAEILSEPTPAETPVEPQPLREGELDLSDLESMLDGMSETIEPQTAATVVLDLELDAQGTAVDRNAQDVELAELDLSAITGETAGSGESVETVAEGPDKIDLKSDAADSPSGMSDATLSETTRDDELDFSDITNILEEPLTEHEKEAEDAAPELDLFPGDSLPQAAEAAPVPQSEVQEGLLLDLESLLEQEDASDAAAESNADPASEELDLDITLGPPSSMSNDLEIEIESATEGSESDGPAGQIAGAEAMIGNRDAATDPFSAEEDGGTDTNRATDSFQMESGAMAAMAAEAPRHSGLRKYLIAAAGAAALLGAVVIVPRGLGIQVPFLSDLEVPFLGKVFQSQPEDVLGNIGMAPIAEKLTAEFIDHPGAGRLCVVRGQVRNNYDHPRSAIRVTAKLFNKDKTQAKSATVYAGNVLASQDLLVKDIAAINAALKTKEGVNNQNVGVKPGQTVPFMAVFDNLPDNLDEYSVEVAGSTK